MKVIVRPGDRVVLKDAGAVRVVWVEGTSVTLELNGNGETPLAVELLAAQQRGQKKNDKRRPPLQPPQANQGANGKGRAGKRHTNQARAGSR